MKHLAKFLFLGTLLAASATGAQAGTLSGTIAFSGQDVVTPGVSIAFANPAPSASEVATTATGTFAGITSGTFFNLLQGGLPQVLFTASGGPGGASLSFTATSAASFIAPGVFQIIGTLTESGSSILADNGTLVGIPLTFTEQAPTFGPGSPVAFNAVLSTAPEPSSLVLLGTGLVGAAGMLLRKKRQVSL